MYLKYKDLKSLMWLIQPGQGKHNEPVWNVRWVRDNLDGHLNFYRYAGLLLFESARSLVLTNHSSSSLAKYWPLIGLVVV